MRCVVTGAAGFIGSHLCEELLRRGHIVVGIDAFVPNYPPEFKARNQAVVLAHPHYHFHALDLRSDLLESAVADADVVFHLAAVSGSAKSWSAFDDYLSCNVSGTHRLLEAVRVSASRLKRFVYASASSVYGTLAVGGEAAPAQPVSPYGVSKLAAEQLCRAHADEFALPVVILRYFNVYGPRQRPDMAYHSIIEALLQDRPVRVFGDGRQVRGSTFVGDCVAATVAAAEAPVGEVYNVGGGEAVSLLDAIRKLESISGRRAEIVFEPARPGDQRHAHAESTKFRNHVGWVPLVRLDDGLERQWHSQAAPGTDGGNRSVTGPSTRTTSAKLIAAR
ncbi:NAD-dependent epimerase/dehydratase family protein [Fimbriiglobus ruber]|uniref:UDP-glucose 4-epimerase n=1 Tax=Fimbriiglobus ruber TaxID=1908690 RepID=A0A225E1Q0_9BACT|nr:NAD-dependent epimerase/dehydratase family protein [Fimbriiglobus ruber]OWK47512.1 UDP-glucose 4-epimerase [Fimbriiglobus ruber]